MECPATKSWWGCSKPAGHDGEHLFSGSPRPHTFDVQDAVVIIDGDKEYRPREHSTCFDSILDAEIIA